jgi:glutamyl-tRNA(Gln) amidotransferase subunit E
MKAGLEIHQQLKTGKLFCRCPSVLREEEPHFKVSRKLRPVASETGARDAVSEAEAAKNKTFVYEAYLDTTCLVEIDEEPPHEIDSEALEIAITVAKSLNCKIVPELHTMRKAIIDGSCPSGFQRTALLATGGWLEVSGKKIGIETICIEEDAGRIISADSSGTVFRVDRLGIPLVEIATAPDISSPEEAKAVAEKIGTILRLTGRVVRGLGSIRQDLNVSTEGGDRVEIKGMQWLDLIPLFVRNEIARQESLVRIGKSFSYGAPEKRLVDVSSVFKNTSSKVLAQRSVFATAFPRLSGIMREALHEGKHFGREVAEYVKVMTSAKGFFHTDELPAYGVTPEEVLELRKTLGVSEGDLVCIVAEEPGALRVVEWRLSKINSRVMRETRKANQDGSTSFLRTIAGSARFYPETDVSPVLIEPLARNAVPVESAEKRLSALKELGLSDKLAEGLLLSEDYPLFSLAVSLKVAPVLAATIVEENLPYLRRKGVDVDGISDSSFGRLFSEISEGRIIRDGVSAAIEILSRGGEISGIAGNPVAEEEVVCEIRKLVLEKTKYIKENGAQRAFPGLMGLLMSEFRGRFDGARLKTLLQDNLLNQKGSF